MYNFDIRAYKTRLRNKYKTIRKGLPPEEKQKRDQAVLKRLISTKAYRSAHTILTYVSTPIEVDTLALIQRAWKDKKRVAAPRCVDGTRDMVFYFIRSMNDLERHTFGVLEPIPSRCEQVTDFRRSICIVPGLCFDQAGYRLGYGKGYYDRFLSKYKGCIIGICYSNCMRYSLKHGRYDVACEMVISDRYIHRVKSGGGKYARPSS